ncbi:MAG: 3-dehydroquinate synthase [Rhodothermales bacterium]
MPITNGRDALHVELGAGRDYPIIFHSLDHLAQHLIGVGLSPGRCIVVTDENVASLHAETVTNGLVSAGFRPVTITLPAGETTKSADHLGRIYDEVLQRGVERGTPLVAVGGGVIGDLAGYAAATLLRGVPLVHVPTSLIAQVDSSIGGKTGINHPTGKNLIGAFYQPRMVLTDTSLLQTLPLREWTSGLAEVVKHGLIADETLFGDLERNWADVVDRKPETLEHIIPAAAAVKVRIVSRDERESGLRETLNFGHTFAHAIERVSGYGTYTHGEAVAAGMRAALHLSRHINPDISFDRADALVARIDVPPGLTDLSIRALMEAMKSDKKVRDGTVRYVVLDRIGQAFVTEKVSRRAVERAWDYAREAVG